MANGPTSAFSDEELLALLRDESVSPESIAAEMEDAGATPHPVDALSTTRGVLKSLGPEQAAAVEGLPAVLRALVLDVAVDKQCVDLLTALARSADKGMVKDAKRALHGLKSRGMKIEAVKPAAPVPVAAPAVEEFPVYMSSIDGLGRRLLFFPGAVRGGVDLAQLLISDEVGVVTAELAPLARKEYRRFIDRLLGLSDMLITEVPRAWARSLVAAALDLNARARKAVPASFNDVAFLLGPRVEPQPSPARALPLPEDTATLRTSGAELLKLKEFLTWLPPEPDQMALERQVEAVRGSTLYIDANQRNAAIKDLVTSSVATFWTRETRDRYAARLYDMAWLLHRARRADTAALVLATASGLAGEGPLEGIPFAFAFFEQAVPQGEEPDPGGRPQPSVSPGGIILPP